MFTRLFILIILLGCRLTFSQESQLVTVMDIWTAQPISGVRIIGESDTLFSDLHGKFDRQALPDRPATINITHKNYFEANLKQVDLASAIIYLTPIEYADIITVVAPQESDSRLMLPSHVTRIVLDSEEQRLAGLERILAAENGLLVKSYGAAGQLQTLSLRGMRAGQTQVLLDGIPLNSLQLGEVDLGQYNEENLGVVEIYRGGSYLFGGSGAIGGAINMHPQKLTDDLGYRLKFTAASFGNQQTHAALSLPVGPYHQQLSFSAADGRNNYQVVYNDSSFRLSNHDYRRSTLAYQGEYAISEQWKAGLLITDYRKRGGSPAPVSTASNLARQTLSNTLTKTHLRYDGARVGGLLQFYVRNEWMSYNDPTWGINSLHFNQEKGLQARARFLSFENVLLHAGAEVAAQKVHSTDLSNKERTRWAAFLLGDWRIFSKEQLRPALHLNGSARIEAYSDFGREILPGLGLSLQWSDAQIFASAGKNYRAPTFNDLYWPYFGNPQLHAEKSNNYEVGAEYHKSIGLIQFSLLADAYWIRVRDQIHWAPDENGVWLPQNFMEVYSRGIELEASIGHINGVHEFKFGYSKGHSAKDKAEYPGDPSVGKQLPNLPEEQWQASLKSGWWKFRGGLHLAQTGQRRDDMGRKLSKHLIVDLWTAMQLDVLRQHISFGFSVGNLFDKKYEVISGYPMPPRNYSMTLMIGM